MAKFINIPYCSSAILFFIAACGDIPQTSGGRSNYIDPSSFIADGAAGQDLVVDVVGNPFPQDADTVRQALVEGMREAYTPTHFIPGETHLSSSVYRVVIAFGLRGNTETLCDNSTPLDLSGPSNVIKIEAAFCRRTVPVTMTSGQVGNVKDVHDPRMATLMRHVAMELMPSNVNPEQHI